MKNISFCKPDINEGDIAGVVEVLKSGWITTGLKTEQFAMAISDYCGSDYTVCLNSATAGLEMTLRLMGIGAGDEVITTPYTYAATINAIIHCGAMPVLADVVAGGFEIDPAEIEKKITNKTKAIIPVDYAGYPCDYQKISYVIESKKSFFMPRNSVQKNLGKILLLVDAAHSLGATYLGKRMSEFVDVAVFSFHAVKNITTAEGGAVTFFAKEGVFDDSFIKYYRYSILHGQSKDALAKSRLGSWEYDILTPGYKCNMTDMSAVLGLSQLARYNQQLQYRESLVQRYLDNFKDEPRLVMPPCEDSQRKSSFHFFPLRITGWNEQQRDEAIAKAAAAGVALNVHYKPIPLFTAYTGLFKMADYPNAFEAYQHEISLPVYPALTVEDIDYICEVVLGFLG